MNKAGGGGAAVLALVMRHEIRPNAERMGPGQRVDWGTPKPRSKRLSQRFH